MAIKHLALLPVVLSTATLPAVSYGVSVYSLRRHVVAS